MEGRERGVRIREEPLGKGRKVTLVIVRRLGYHRGVRLGTTACDRRRTGRQKNVRFYPAPGPPSTPAPGASRARMAPDAFSPGSGARTTPEALAESWRPWRSYAVQHLWAGLEEAPTGKRERQEEMVA